jgi:hypothetical protein
MEAEMQNETGVSWFRMEEEEEEGWTPPIKHFGFGPSQEARQPEHQEAIHSGPPRPMLPEILEEFLRSLAQERRSILENEKLSAKQKCSLLDENRKTLVVATGGKVTKTDSVVYGILVFGGIVLIILALLTTFAHLPSEVTLSFVGTVLGGTIATIAQKLGKI